MLILNSFFAQRSVILITKSNKFILENEKGKYHYEEIHQ